VDVVSARLVDSSSGGLIRVLIDSALELLQELVDVQKIALCPKVRKWERVRVVHRRVCRLSDHGTSMSVLAHAAALVAATTSTEDWKLNSLETHESLADIIVG
jgi:hypothetical protein